ncbi:hypothetical protein NP493_53g21032 [Ridgeia piscesae]|uniref:Uncharacterized protein n=1 Tax=Ridgeia piscesae TaxID=27915 RepID=A0AAD9PAX6_RIDPI|nr:hypothetical protein NP493_53g21032 [Ridgeia piscesae]
MKVSSHACSAVSGVLYMVGTLVCLRACLAADRDDENEVIKRGGKRVPSVELGAIYYQKYADSGKKKTLPPRRGYPSLRSSCTKVAKVPRYYRRSMRIDNYYQKYMHAYGIPVLGASSVSDRAMRRACYVLRFLLGDRHDLVKNYYEAYGRVAIIPAGAKLRSLPEFRFLPRQFDDETPGLGATVSVPVSVAREENIVCDSKDKSPDDILLQTLAEGIYQLAVRKQIPGYDAELRRLYNSALATGWWKNTYSRYSPEVYFSEGVQSFFNVNSYADPPNGYSNRVNSRSKLQNYDARLFRMIHFVFPCGNNYLTRCNSRGE